MFLSFPVFPVSRLIVSLSHPLIHLFLIFGLIFFFQDVCVQATTGSGKTIAFGIPIFEILNRRTDRLKKYEVGALVIAPTRSIQLVTIE